MAGKSTDRTRPASDRKQTEAAPWIPPEPVIPDGIPAESMPSLLANWFLGSKARRHLSRRRFVTVSGLLPPGDGGRALDVGCGWGYNLFLLRSRGYESWGIDIVQNDFAAAGMIASANGYSNNLVGADVSSLPFSDGSFRAVTAVETFEHIFHPDRRKALSEIARVLSPGGSLVLSTPNYRSVVETGKRLVNRMPFLKKALPTMCYPVGAVERSDYHPYSYHRPSPLKEIKGMLDSAGFYVDSAEWIIFIWKSVPDPLFGCARLAERCLESIPLVRRLASTLVVSATKR